MPPTSFGSPASHASVQFLNSVLSQRGPAALPYEEGLKLTIRSHLVNLLEEFPSLQVKTETFTHNDGKSSNLLQVDGTIPMYYLEVMYNIPVTFWLLEDYPKKPPRVFVTPTRDMIIKRPHRYVDPSGLVSVPYIQSWVFPRSNLVELVRSLSLIFGQEPPLYSKPPTTTSPYPQAGHSPPRPPPPHSATMAFAHGSGQQQQIGMNNNPPPPPHPHAIIGSYPPPPQKPSTTTTTSVSTASPASQTPITMSSQQNTIRPMPPTTSASPYPSYPGPPGGISQQHPYPPYRNPPPQRTNSEPPSAEIFRRNAINTLVDRLQHDVAEHRKKQEVDIEKFFSAQGALRQREEVCKKGFQELQQEKECLEQQLQIILTNTDILETWLKANVKNDTNVDVDSAFEPCDVLSKQLLECSASDLAVEDVLYSLDKAVQEGAIPVDAYLKHVRALSREQFLHRATGLKVKAAQAQSQIEAMARRAGSYSS